MDGAAENPGEVPTPRTLSYRDGYLPALRLEVVTQRCRQRCSHVPGEHQIVLLRGERDAATVRLLLIHLQHVGTLGDVLEARQDCDRAWTGGGRWSDSEAEDQRHHEDEHRHPDETGAVSCFGSERVQLVSFTFHFSFTFHLACDTPEGDVGI